MDLKEEAILGDSVSRHWYYQSKAKAMQRLLGPVAPRSILDVGSGSGFFTRYLLTRTNATEGWCVDTGYAKDWDETVEGKPLRFSRSCDTSAADIVLMMDVLEHVPDDAGLLADYASKVAAGTHFLLTVPAFSFLWSSHDVYLEHYRRYTVPMLEAAVRKAGLEVVRSCYYFAGVFPLVVAVRMAGNLFGKKNSAPQSDMRRHSELSNAILSGVCSVELPLFPFNRIAGLSVFCLARKP